VFDPTRIEGARGICRLGSVSGGVGGVVKRPVTGRLISVEMIDRFYARPLTGDDVTEIPPRF
jgi:hypothetical protein